MTRPDDVTPPSSGLSPQRLEQLKRDMLLTPEERVRIAEETLQLDKLRHPHRTPVIRSFERYEDYLDYKFNVRAGSG